MPNTFHAELAVIILCRELYHSSVRCCGCGMFRRMVICWSSFRILYSESGLNEWTNDLLGIMHIKYVNRALLMMVVRSNSVDREMTFSKRISKYSCKEVSSVSWKFSSEKVEIKSSIYSSMYISAVSRIVLLSSLVSIGST